MAQQVKSLLAVQETQEHRFDSWSGRSPGGEHGNPTQYSCLKKTQGQRSMGGYSPWGHKELDTTEWLNMQTHYPWGSIVSFETGLKLIVIIYCKL